MPTKSTARTQKETEMVCYSCSTVPFGALNMVSLLAALCCVLAVLVILSSIMIQTQQAQLRELIVLVQHMSAAQ